MSTDLLRAYANERIDLVDFDFLADSGFQDNIHQPNAQFFTDPGGQRSWILDGFEITNVGGTKQVVVTKGRAILARREGAIVHYGTLTVEGDATKIIDMSTLTPNAGYGLYLRFEYVDGDTGSRVFWNPAGSGSEVAQSVATRRKANWSIRTELSSPGSEWLRIATVSNIPTPVGITDERPLYFEGEVHNSYQSGWSTDGGGVANDRSADRQQYGVKDFQGFTAAMRQCLEDIKGRGLRRWWARDIGGMNIGFDAAPVEDKLQVGSVDTFVDGGAAKLIQADTDVYLDGANHELYVESDVFLDGTDRRLELDTDVYFDADGAGEAKLSLASDAYWDATLTNRIMQLAPSSYWIHFNATGTSTLYMGTSAYIGYASDYFSISVVGGSSAQFHGCW